MGIRDSLKRRWSAHRLYINLENQRAILKDLFEHAYLATSVTHAGLEPGDREAELKSLVKIARQVIITGDILDAHTRFDAWIDVATERLDENEAMLKSFAQMFPSILPN